MNPLFFIFVLVYIYLLTVLKRAKLPFAFFCIGSVGMFVFTVVLLQPLVTVPMQKAVAAVAGLLGQAIGIYQSYFQYGILFIQSKTETISMYIDYECSGIIEIVAFLSLLWFFPVYSTAEKIFTSIIGFITIFLSNVLRIFVICLIIFFFGNDAFFIAHTIIGRFVFYFCSIILYFFVFTRPQVIKQKVGRFSYENK